MGKLWPTVRRLRTEFSCKRNNEGAIIVKGRKGQKVTQPIVRQVHALVKKSFTYQVIVIVAGEEGKSCTSCPPLPLQEPLQTSVPDFSVVICYCGAMEGTLLGIHLSAPSSATCSCALNSNNRNKQAIRYPNVCRHPTRSPDSRQPASSNHVKGKAKSVVVWHGNLWTCRRERSNKYLRSAGQIAG